MGHQSLISAILDYLDPVSDLLGTQYGHLLGCKGVIVVSPDWSYPVPSLFHLVQPIWGTLGHQSLISAILDHLDPIWDLLGTQYGHLLVCKGVIVVSPDCPYPVPTLFHLVPPLSGPLGPSEPYKCCFGPFGPKLGPFWTHRGSKLSPKMSSGGTRLL